MVRTLGSSYRVVALAVIVLVTVAGLTHPPKALANYNCSLHCYGRVGWRGNVDYGAGGNISVQNIQDNGDGSLVNTIWVVDQQTPHCMNNFYKLCWVEAGYNSNSGSGDTYYWADVGKQDQYFYHMVANVPSNDLGLNVQMKILYDGGTQWHVKHTSPTLGTYIGYSYNDMIGNDILAGEELTGTTGGYAPAADWTNNWWADHNYYAWYEYFAGDQTSSNPPYGYYVAPPTGSYGGDWQAYCC